MRLDLTFRWSAPPGYFQKCAHRITCLHCANKPVSPIIGNLAFPPLTFVDDATIIEVELPKRLGISAEIWGDDASRSSDMAHSAVRRKRWKVDGWLGIYCSDSIWMWGRRISNSPTPTLKARNWPSINPVLTPVAPLRLQIPIQELRGLFALYRNFNPLWGTLARPIDSILGYPDVSSLWKRCGEFELRTPFRGAISAIRRITWIRDDWWGVCTGYLLGLIPINIRTSGPDPRGRGIWFAGDATLTRSPRINWAYREFIYLPVSDILDPFTPRHQQIIIISDIELLSIVFASV